MPTRDRLRNEVERTAPQCTVHVVHLYERGQFLRTLTDAFSAAGAEEFVRCYNRLGARTERHAVATVHVVTLPEQVAAKRE